MLLNMYYYLHNTGQLYRIAFIITILYLQLLKANGDNNCRIDKVEIPMLLSRIILTFECYSGDDYNNLIIPIDNGNIYAFLN